MFLSYCSYCTVNTLQQNHGLFVLNEFGDKITHPPCVTVKMAAAATAIGLYGVKRDQDSPFHLSSPFHFFQMHELSIEIFNNQTEKSNWIEIHNYWFLHHIIFFNHNMHKFKKKRRPEQNKKQTDKQTKQKQKVNKMQNFIVLVQ